jgi:hypothetical protein
MPTTTMDTLPLWALFLAAVASILLSLTVGFRAGLLRRKQAEGEPEGPVGSVAGATLGLLAFMLAFTFGMTANRFDTRKQLLLDEVNALGTAALRADLLPEPHRAECRELLKRYVDLRVEMPRDVRKLPQALKESEALQDQLWSHAMALARADMNSDIGALFVESLNTVIDLHTSRVTVALKYRIPAMIWYALILLTILSMAAVGYHFGILGRSSAAVHLILALSFSLVFLLIADLDRGASGLLKVSQQPMIDLQQKLSHPVQKLK